MSRLSRFTELLIKETDCFQSKHHPPGAISVSDITILVEDCLFQILLSKVVDIYI